MLPHCCRLAEHQQLLPVLDAITRLSRTPDAEVRCAVSRAAASLASAELEGQLPEGACLAPLVGVMTALLGPEQPSEVQRQQMQVSRPSHVLSQLCQHGTVELLAQGRWQHAMLGLQLSLPVAMLLRGGRDCGA